MQTRVRHILGMAVLASLAACGPGESPTDLSTPSAASLATVTEFAGTAASAVTLDIKPGSCPNPLNPVSMGSFPVAVAGNAALDVTNLDVASIQLEGIAPLRHAVEDVTSPGGCCDLTSLLRVNAGGVLIVDSPQWSEDTSGNPSPFVNTGFAAATAEAVDLSHPSIPAGTPMNVFQSERADFSIGDEMRWEFPVEAGQYTVRLYFAEIYPITMSVGARVFDVLLEGDLVLDDYDVYAKVGGLAGVVEEFEVMVTDGALTVEFRHEIENPKISAIEILKLGGAPQPDGIDDLVMKFDTQALVGALGTPSPGEQLSLTLTGALTDGTPFSDTDCVVIVGRPIPVEYGQ